LIDCHDHLNDETNDYSANNKMSELNICSAVNGNTETEYPKSDTNGSLSGASTIPKDNYASVEVFAGDDLRYRNMNPKVTQAIRVVK
jgi:hypothetical protein